MRTTFSFSKSKNPRRMYCGELTGRHFVIRRNPVGRKGFSPVITGLISIGPNSGTKIQMTLSANSAGLVAAFFSIGFISAICLYLTVKLIMMDKFTASPFVFIPYALLILTVTLGRKGYLSEIKTVKRDFKYALEAEEVL